jgi:hypothetical protein
MKHISKVDAICKHHDECSCRDLVINKINVGVKEVKSRKKTYWYNRFKYTCSTCGWESSSFFERINYKAVLVAEFLSQKLKWTELKKYVASKIIKDNEQNQTKS